MNNKIIWKRLLPEKNPLELLPDFKISRQLQIITLELSLNHVSSTQVYGLPIWWHHLAQEVNAHQENRLDGFLTLCWVTALTWSWILHFRIHTNLLHEYNRLEEQFSECGSWSSSISISQTYWAPELLNEKHLR